MAVVHFVVDENRRCLPRPRIFRDMTNPLYIYDDDVNLLSRFLIPRNNICEKYNLQQNLATTKLEIIDIVEEDISPATGRSHAIPAALQVMRTLRYATGNFQPVGGDIISISQPSVSRTVNSVES